MRRATDAPLGRAADWTAATTYQAAARLGHGLVTRLAYFILTIAFEAIKEMSLALIGGHGAIAGHWQSDAARKLVLRVLNSLAASLDQRPRHLAVTSFVAAARGRPPEAARPPCLPCLRLATSLPPQWGVTTTPHLRRSTIAHSCLRGCGRAEAASPRRLRLRHPRAHPVLPPSRRWRVLVPWTVRIR